MDSKFLYDEPIMEIIHIVVRDVITGSPGTGGVWDGGEGDTEEDVTYPASVSF